MTGLGPGLERSIKRTNRPTIGDHFNVFSRKIVGHEVYETETGGLAAELFQKA